MSHNVYLHKTTLLIFASLLNAALLFSASPQLIWHQNYGEATLNQQLVVTAIDNYDNFFAAGYVNFGAYGNVLVNRYDGVGNLKWNRVYNNVQTSAAPDKPIGLFPNNQAGVTVVSYVNKLAVLTHIYSYDAAGNLANDVFIGDTTTGSKTQPFAVIYDNASSFYLLGQLNSQSKVFKCSSDGSIVWSADLHNNYNPQVGSLSFDVSGNIVVGVSDIATAKVIIHLYQSSSGTELGAFNTQVTSLPVNDNFIKIQVDQNYNVLLCATGIDTAGRSQLVIDKFDNTGILIWSTMCNSSRGHSNTVNSFIADHVGDVLISGPYTDNADAWQYGGVYKLSNDSGHIIWAAIDTQFLVNSAVVQVDLFDNVYFGTTKTPSAISSKYSNFSFSQLSPDSGIVGWNRSFDNSTNNINLITQVNNFGDIFLGTTATTDSNATWFLGRVGNAAGDVVGTAVKQVGDYETNLSVFPNPFISEATIAFTSLVSESCEISLYDVTGNKIQREQIQVATGYNQVKLKTDITPGVYLLQVTGNNFKATKSVVIY